MRPNVEILCLVCGDRASGRHYGVLSCDGCRGFFKRSIRRNLDYKCKEAGTCQVDVVRRNQCQACRFRKCLDVNMNRNGLRRQQYLYIVRSLQFSRPKWALIAAPSAPPPPSAAGPLSSSRGDPSVGEGPPPQLAQSFSRSNVVVPYSMVVPPSLFVLPSRIMRPVRKIENATKFSIDQLLPTAPVLPPPRNLGLLSALVACLRKFGGPIGAQMPDRELARALDRGWHRLFLVHAEHSTADPALAGCPLALHQVVVQLAQLRMSPLEQWALGCAVLFGDEGGVTAGGRAEEIQEWGVMGLIECFLAQRPMEAISRRRFAHLVLLMPRICALEEETVRSQFFADCPLERVRALWRMEGTDQTFGGE